MRFEAPRDGRRAMGGRTGAVVLLATLAAGACGAGTVTLPSPRPLVVPSGARLRPDSAALQQIYDWVNPAVETIHQDPSFFVDTERVPEPSYPWETFEFIESDSVRIALESGVTDPVSTYQIYAFLHIMDRLERMEEWFPEAVDLEGYELERFIVGKTADSWLLGRTIFDTQPYGLLDELIYTQDRGYLEAFLLTARSDEFADEREAYERANPGRLEEFARWFRETFERDPPGYGGP